MLFAPINATAQSLQFFYTDGGVISVEIATENLEWTHVSDAGVSTVRTIRISDIHELVLTDTPAGKQIIKIRQLIEQLDSPKYRLRQEAELKLSNPELSAAYLDLLQQHEDDPRKEVRYRLKRILKDLKKDRVQSNLMFDTLVLKNGDTMQGDAGDFQWLGKFRDRAINVKRNELTSVMERSDAAAKNDAKPTDKVAVELFQKHETFAADKSLRVIDFASDPNGNLLNLHDNVSNTFVPWGLKFDYSGKGYVGVPRYNVPPNSAKGLPVGSQMITKFNQKPGLNGIPYKGEIKFEFCMPNQPTVPAGVHRFGTFIARVDSPRSFILEAFDREGELVGTVETEKAVCGFLGIKSTTPIHRIQIRSNPYLFRVDGNVDLDYALDTFYLSEPVPVGVPVDQPLNGVVLRNGNRLIGNVSLQAADQVIVATDNLGQLKFKLDEVEEIGFGKAQAPNLKTWMATIADGSTLVVDPLQGFKATLLKRSVADNFLCLFNSSNPKRLPVNGDFEQGKQVLVYPTCRIPVDKVDFTKSGFAWSKKAKKLLQPVDEESPLGVPGKDPTPQISKIDYEETTAENLPTVWLAPPKPPTKGFVRLTDGQSLSLGADRKITAMSNDNLELQESGNTSGKLTIPLERVAAIELAE